MFLAAFILFIELLSAIFSHLGFGQISQLLYSIYCTATKNEKFEQRSASVKKIRSLRNEIRLVSSVDEFSKWAKLKRKLDAELKKHETLNSELGIQRSSFEISANVALRALIYLVRFFFLTYYYRTPAFYLPSAWSYPFAYFLSLPASPYGSVSTATWSFVCYRVCSSLISSLNSSFPATVPNPIPQSKSKLN
ncbi:Protein GET1 [Smittium culicis]|uniref:Protein GET1 n=1 Tax=Smittium culicis TaxID=133412 RepID=A0A1R1Y6G0_9FUNG|nr:Protein GET1 [Smittium culicis]